MNIHRHPTQPTSSDPYWDDRRAEFLIAMERLCASAELARLEVAVVTAGGSRIAGYVTTPGTTGDELADTDPPRMLRIDDVHVRLDDVVQLTINPPRG